MGPRVWVFGVLNIISASKCTKRKFSYGHTGHGLRCAELRKVLRKNRPEQVPLFRVGRVVGEPMLGVRQLCV